MKLKKNRESLAEGGDTELNILADLIRAEREIQFARASRPALNLRLSDAFDIVSSGGLAMSPLLSLTFSLVRISFVSCLIRPLISFRARLSSSC